MPNWTPIVLDYVACGIGLEIGGAARPTGLVVDVVVVDGHVVVVGGTVGRQLCACNCNCNCHVVHWVFMICCAERAQLACDPEYCVRTSRTTTTRGVGPRNDATAVASVVTRWTVSSPFPIRLAADSLSRFPSRSLAGARALLVHVTGAFSRCFEQLPRSFGRICVLPILLA